MIKISFERKYALVAGIGLLLMVFFAGFAQMTIFENLIILDNPIQTATNLTTENGIFLMSTLSFGIVILLDFVIAIALYIFFKSINQKISFLSAILRIVYGGIFIVALLSLIKILPLLGKEAGIDEIISHAQTFIHIWDIGFIIFGFHLILLGYLSFLHTKIHNIITILLVIAGGGYIFDSIGRLFIENPFPEIVIYTFIGEIVLMLWLLFKGGKN